jgi:hypothetical protein
MFVLIAPSIKRGKVKKKQKNFDEGESGGVRGESKVLISFGQHLNGVRFIEL